MLRVFAAASVVLIAACPAADSPPCEGHDGGDGSCVAVGNCAADFSLDSVGRCARWRQIEDMPFGAVVGTSQRLLDGRVLFAGGNGEDGNGFVPSARTATFDPSTETWTEVAPLSLARAFHSTVLAPDGRVFVVCGNGPAGNLNEVETFDPSSDSWSFSTPLPGRGLCHGFVDGSGNIRLDIGLVLVGDEWVEAAAATAPRGLGALHPLQGGGAVIVGGQRGAVFVPTVERFDPSSEAWIEVASGALLARDFIASGLLQDGRLFAAGGFLTDQLDTTVIVDLTSGSVEEGPRLPKPINSSGGVAYEDGVLVVGGFDSDTYDDSARLIAAATVVEMPPVPVALAPGGLVTLEDGRILLTGGLSAEGLTTAAYLFERGQ